MGPIVIANWGVRDYQYVANHRIRWKCVTPDDGSSNEKLINPNWFYGFIGTNFKFVFTFELINHNHHIISYINDLDINTVEFDGAGIRFTIHDLPEPESEQWQRTKYANPCFVNQWKIT